MILSILIATIVERKHSFDELIAEIDHQIFKYGFENDIEVCFISDNKELSIGEKRQMLLQMSKGEYIVYIDDDDMINDNYIIDIMQALEQKPDCVGMKILYTYDGENPRTCIHSIKYTHWHDDGVTYFRGCTHFNPVKKSLAIKVGFKPIRYAEDRPYSDALTLLCKNEIFIDKYLFQYRYSSKVPHNKKYGIQ